MTNLVTSADRLSALGLEALTLERQHRLGPQELRTVSLVLPYAVLKVCARYDPKTENRILLWTTATLEKALAGRKLPVHQAYWCDWEGHRVNLTPEGALALLTTGDLPEDVKSHLRAKEAATAAQVARDRDDQGLFDSLNRVDRAASDRSFLLARRQVPRPSVERLCNARPLGATLSTAPDEARCVLKPWHLGTEPHRNSRGETWGVVQRPIDRVEEAVKPW